MKKKFKRSISMLLIIFIFGNVFMCESMKNKPIHAASITHYYDTCIQQTINGIAWNVQGTVTSNSEKPGMYLSKIKKVTISNIDSLNIKDIIIPDSIQEGGITADITMLSEGIFKENTKIENVTLNSKITSIEDKCFYKCKNLKSVVAGNNTNTINIGSETFSGCTSLDKFDVVLGDVKMYAFNNCTNIKSVEIGGDGERIIGNNAFANTGLSELKLSKKLTTLNLGASCFKNTSLINITVPCDCIISSGAFENCFKLQKLEFEGKVIREEQHQMYSESSMSGTFEGAFALEYDEKGNIIDKEVIFHDMTSFQHYEELADKTRKRGDFANCSGLTKVTFYGETTIPKYTFYNCNNLKTVNFNAQSGIIRLGSYCFSGCKLKELNFYTELYCIEDELAASPFTNSNLINLNITPVEEKGCFVNVSSNTLENLYFGENVDYIAGKIYDSLNVKKIVIENPKLKPIERTASDFGYSGKNLLEDTLTQRHHIIGYSSNNASLQNVEEWIEKYSDNGIFTNLIQKSSIKVSDLKYIGSIKKEDIDFNKINVTYSKYDDVTKELQAELSPNNTDITGYILETTNLPKILETDNNEVKEYIYTVILSGEQAYGKIIIEPKKIIDLNIDWKIDRIKELVSNQPITISDIVSGASVVYNDGEIKTVPISELNLENVETTENNNTFTVNLKENINIKNNYTTNIPKNFITSIDVSYSDENPIFVGDSIDISKINLYPHYKYDSDPQLNREIEVTKISKTTIDKEGTNEIEVFYGDISVLLYLKAVKVVPTSITAYFDSDNYKYIADQKEIEKKSIKARVTYNNGDIKEINGEELDGIEVVSELSTELGIKAKYQNIESPIFYINVTPKQIKKIKVNNSVKSAIEGTTLSKSMISSIDITYNNGVTENLPKEKIDYEKLILKNTEIKAGVENVIVVEYLGITDSITIIGIPNTIKCISAVYTGTGVPVGNEVKLSDIKIIASNTNGIESEINNGCLLENSVIYSVGTNNVIVHYGELQCIVEVKGIAAIPTPTSPFNTITPPTTIPTTPIPTITSGSTLTPTTTPNIKSTTTPIEPIELPPNDLPSGIVTVTKSAVTFNSSIKSIKIAKKKTYNLVTNKDVVVTCKVKNATNLKYQFVKKGDAIKTNRWKPVKKNKIKITNTSDKPGILYIQYLDYTGKIKRIYTTGFKIDKKKATANIKNNKTYKKGQKITFKDASGIKDAKLDGKNVKAGKKVTKKGKHTLILVDKAGNKTIIKFMIK